MKRLLLPWVLSLALFAHAAEPPRAPDVRPPRKYTARVELHEVDLGAPAPAEERATTANRAPDYRQGSSSSVGPNERPTTAPVLAPEPLDANPSRGRKDQGWGWLAAEVMQRSSASGGADRVEANLDDDADRPARREGSSASPSAAPFDLLNPGPVLAEEPMRLRMHNPETGPEPRALDAARADERARPEEASSLPPIRLPEAVSSRDPWSDGGRAPLEGYVPSYDAAYRATAERRAEPAAEAGEGAPNAGRLFGGDREATTEDAAARLSTIGTSSARASPSPALAGGWSGVGAASGPDRSDSLLSAFEPVITSPVREEKLLDRDRAETPLGAGIGGAAAEGYVQPSALPW